MTLQEIVQEVHQLSIEERKQLIGIIVDTLTESSETPPRKRSIMELAGIGAELYDGTDAQEYVNQLRSEWDHRP